MSTEVYKQVLHIHMYSPSLLTLRAFWVCIGIIEIILFV